MTKSIITSIFTILIFPIIFLLVTIPSMIYGISTWLLLPVGFLLRLFIGRPTGTKAGLITLKLSTIFLLVIVPAMLYLYVWEPLGWIFFVWMASYLLSRIYSGVHEKEKMVIEAWKHLAALEEKYKHTYIKYNRIATIIAIFLNVASPVTGYYFGGEKGLWIGIAFAAVIWCLSPFTRVTIIEKSETGNNQP